MWTQGIYPHPDPLVLAPLSYPRTVEHRNEIHFIALMPELYALGSVANNPIGILTHDPDQCGWFCFKRGDVVDGLGRGD